MFRLLGLALIGCSTLVSLPAVADAQEWARKMFTVTSHDFGTVARSSKQEFVFEFENLYEEDLHIASVRSSCGCTSPRLTKSSLKTFEKGAVIATFNTTAFLGQRSATITVTIDRPYYAEVQLSVQGYIRSDVVFDPGVVNLGEMKQTEGGQADVRVSYAGRADWQIVDVRSANANFEVELDTVSRRAGQVIYSMRVHLKPNAPAGYLHDQLTLVTDDQNMPTIPLLVEGKVLPALAVSPPSLFLGILEPGETVTKQLVVKGDKPFKVVGVQCPDCFEFQVPEESKKLHLIPVTFTAGSEPGEAIHEIKIATDMGEGLTTSCQASATVRAPAGQ